MHDWLDNPKTEEVEPKVYAILLRSNQSAGHHAVFCAVAYSLEQAHKEGVAKLVREGAIKHTNFAIVAYHTIDFAHVKKYAEANKPPTQKLEAKMVDDTQQPEPLSEHNQLIQRIIASGDATLLADSKHLFKPHEVAYIEDEIARRKRGEV